MRDPQVEDELFGPRQEPWSLEVWPSPAVQRGGVLPFLEEADLLLTTRNRRASFA